jgi:multidrug efflux system outer membrane protein
MITRRSLSGLLLSSLFLLQACAPTIPKLKKDVLPLPSHFSEGEDETSASGATLTWREFFHDEKLSELIGIALSNNQDLSILEQEINIASNEILSRQGEYLPKFNVGAGAGVEKRERFSTDDANSRTRFGHLGVSTTWEVDIWGKLRNATKSAYYEYLSSVEARRYIVTNIVSEVANTYFELMSLDNQLEIIGSYVHVLTEINKMVKLQQEAGRVTSLPVKRFEAEVLKNQARQKEIEQRLVVTENRLNLLLGRYPQHIDRSSKKFIEYTFSKISSNVPSKLLDNRPDVRRAELELKAAKLNVKVAKARFYPALSIDGEYGYESFNSKHFDGTPTSVFYGLAANLTAPILNRNAIKADYLSANSRQLEAVYDYEKTILNAYTEVVNQMSMIKNYDSVYKLKASQVKTLNESVEISNVLFRAARVDYVESLLTQRDSLESQVELVEVKQQQLSAYVNLYKTLGGGWR